MAKIYQIVLVSLLSLAVLTSSIVGIWLGVRNTELGPHPDSDWELMITGNIVGGDFNLTMGEITEMNFYKQKYTIRGSTTTTNVYLGVSLDYLFTNEININETVDTVVFVSEDERDMSFSIAEITSNGTNIIAYAIDGEYLLNQSQGGSGYLRLIIPPESEEDFNGPKCLKWIIEIRFI